VVAALIATMIVTFLFELPDLGDQKILKFCIGLGSILSLVLLMMSVVHSVFCLLIINEIRSLDEMICWLEKISWKISFPMRLFMVGLWMSVMTVGTYTFAIFEWQSASIIMASAMGVFYGGHVVLSSMLQDYYEAGAEVANGWRIMKDHRASMSLD
jgi:hypothetical protein